MTRKPEQNEDLVRFRQELHQIAEMSFNEILAEERGRFDLRIALPNPAAQDCLDLLRDPAGLCGEDRALHLIDLLKAKALKGDDEPPEGYSAAELQGPDYDSAESSLERHILMLFCRKAADVDVPLTVKVRWGELMGFPIDSWRAEESDVLDDFFFCEVLRRILCAVLNFMSLEAKQRRWLKQNGKRDSLLNTARKLESLLADEMPARAMVSALSTSSIPALLPRALEDATALRECLEQHKANFDMQAARIALVHELSRNYRFAYTINQLRTGATDIEDGGIKQKVAERINEVLPEIETRYKDHLRFKTKGRQRFIYEVTKTVKISSLKKDLIPVLLRRIDLSHGTGFLDEFDDRSPLDWLTGGEKKPRWRKLSSVAELD